MMKWFSYALASVFLAICLVLGMCIGKLIAMEMATQTEPATISNVLLCDTLNGGEYAIKSSRELFTSNGVWYVYSPQGELILFKESATDRCSAMPEYMANRILEQRKKELEKQSGPTIKV